MAGNTLHQIGHIIHDIKESWYFRIWGILWLACAIIVASILITLGQSSSQALTEKDVMVWVENAPCTVIQFPRFHFHTGWDSTMQITNLTCFHNTAPVTVGPCPTQYSNGPNTCFTVYADSFSTSALTSTVIWGDERILCNMTTTGNSTMLGSLVAFEIEGTDEESVGSNSYASIWIAPNNMAWVMLEKSIFTYANGGNITDWDRYLLYHSTQFTQNNYGIEVIIGNFEVWHIDQTDIYNGMMAMGDVGGFAYFMLIIHSILMIFIGLCFLNTSSFLQPQDEATAGSDYNALKH